MTDMNDDMPETIEISDEELEEMVEEALDILALALPDDADDAYWAQVRATVEQRAADLMVEGPEGE
jgi:hypothetical protein